MKKNDGESDNVFSIFTGLDKLFNVVADMVENEKDEKQVNGTIRSDNQKKVIGKYGFNIKLGPDKLEGFSNFMTEDKSENKTHMPKKTVPVTDVFAEEDKVTIVAELPGVEKEDIEFRLDQNKLTFTAANKDICYSKTVELNFVPDIRSIDEIFKNSIYSIIIKKSNK